MMFSKEIAAVCLISALLFAVMSAIEAQPTRDYWQQEVKYTMDVDLDVETNIFTGHQTIVYTNHSPETLDKVYFHLYLNAFQPGSAMDVAALSTPEPDPRIGRRISRLTPEQIGYQHILLLKQAGRSLEYEVNGTILEVKLAKPLAPGKKTTLYVEYEAQVPLQTRRTGRDNAEGIRYSMAQWYPKLCEYDRRGWHADPYISREFYGVWGDFDVTITLNADYIVAASGILRSGKQAGPNDGNKKTWNFVARNVHDFVWAADPDYIKDVYTCQDGLILQAYYQPHATFQGNWKKLLPIMEEALKYINTHFGQYPYPVYSFIQGGDGGMEYPMATLITGNRSLTSLVGVSVHEMMHSWYQMVLGFNESYYYWMDEGFVDYAEIRVMNHLRTTGLIPGEPDPSPFDEVYLQYLQMVMGGLEEPLSTHADHFETHSGYSISAYSKGAIFLNQLEYVIGKPAFDQGLLDFFNTWKFKHPDDNDLIRVMERTSGLELDWYKDYMVYSTKFIDYGIDTVFESDGKTMVTLARKFAMPMPIDLEVTLQNGQRKTYTIPLDIMLGAKSENDAAGDPVVVLSDWDWVNPHYQITLPFIQAEITSIVLDPSRRMADLDPQNNFWPATKGDE